MPVTGGPVTSHELRLGPARFSGGLQGSHDSQGSHPERPLQRFSAMPDEYGSLLVETPEEEEGALLASYRLSGQWCLSSNCLRP